MIAQLRRKHQYHGGGRIVKWVIVCMCLSVPVSQDEEADTEVVRTWGTKNTGDHLLHHHDLLWYVHTCGVGDEHMWEALVGWVGDEDIWGAF
jgi:hypothetical protein